MVNVVTVFTGLLSVPVFVMSSIVNLTCRGTQLCPGDRIPRTIKSVNNQVVNNVLSPA